MKKRFLSLLVSLTLLLGLIPAFSPTAVAESSKPTYEHYVTLGTSITGGYGLNHSNRNSAVGSFGKGAYAGLVADYFGIPSHYDGALLGTRTYEFRLALEEELEEKDDYTEGWAQAKCRNGIEHLKQIGPTMRSQLAKADLISVELGSNEMMSYLMFRFTQYVEEMSEGSDAEEQIHSLIESLDYAADDERFAGLLAIAEEYGFTQQIFPKLISDEMTSINDFKNDFDTLLDDIKEIKDTTDGSVPYEDTQIVVVSVYNSFRFLLENEVTNDANGSGAIRELVFATGDVLNLPQSVMTSFVELVTNPLTSNINTFLSGSGGFMTGGGSRHAGDENYLYVDVEDIDMIGSADGTHPDFVGHAYIAEHIETALLRQYIKATGTECEHLHTVVTGATVPTSRRAGSTGSVVCQDCGEVLVQSRTLTYDEYLASLPQDPGETGENDYPDVPYSVLAFTSDIHNSTGDVAAGRLANWLTVTQEKEGKFSFFGSCGDTANGNNSANGDAYWDLAAKVFDVLKNSDVPYYAFTTGNHEQGNGGYGLDGSTLTHEAAKNIKRNIAADLKTGANYNVYCFGAAPVDSSSDYKFLDDEIAMLKTYLDSVDPTEPVFVMSHYPLHNSGGRTIKNIDNLISMLNGYPNVIFVWGHNHTNADDEEKHYDQIFTDYIDDTPIEFTYASAGCMSDTEYSDGSAAVKGKGLIATVSPENEVTLVYVDADGQELGIPVTVSLAGGKHKPVEKISGSYSYEKVSTPVSGKEYLVVYNNGGTRIALNTTLCPGYSASRNAYNGLKGAAVTVSGDAVTDGVMGDMIWKFTESGKGFTVKNVLTGRYLSGSYGTVSRKTTGSLTLGSNADIWTLSGGKLKSGNGGKSLTFDTASSVSGSYTGECDLFTVRGNGVSLEFYEVTGHPLGEEEEEEKPSLDGKKFVIISKGYALSAIPNGGYVNTSNYTYTGFDGAEVAIVGRKLISYISEDMVFELEYSGNGYYIKKDGKYLSSEYHTSGTKGGKIELGDTKEVWTFEGNKLKGANSEKYLTFDVIDKNDIATGNDEFFTIRSVGNAAPVYFYDVTDILANQRDDLGICMGVGKIGKDTFNIVVNGRVIGIKDGALVTVSKPEKVSDLGREYSWDIAAKGDGWTLQNAESGDYLGVYLDSTVYSTTGLINLTKQEYIWNYDHGFSAQISTRGFLGMKTTQTVYLVVNGSGVSVSTVAVGNGAELYKKFAAHNFVKTTDGHGNEIYVCSHCGKAYSDEAPEILIGDANSDGVVDTADATAILKYLIGAATVNEAAANCNGDDVVDTADATAILKYLIGAYTFAE